MNWPDWLVARPISHRGLHDRTAGLVENSLSAAEAAIAAGFAIECDVQDTADGDSVVFHDFTLDRLTGETGPVRARRSDELARLALAGSADRIPTLAAFLDRIAGRTPLVIEIKSRFDGDLRLTARTAEVVGAYAGPVAIKSFDPVITATLFELIPALPRGIVAESRYDHSDWSSFSGERKHDLANLLHFPESRPDFLSWRVDDLPSAAPFLCRHLGRLPVMAWTVRTDDDRRRSAAHADQMVFEGFHPEGLHPEALRPDGRGVASPR
jgi:glycerophosphoryl diester phosphodiesterase